MVLGNKKCRTFRYFGQGLEQWTVIKYWQSKESSPHLGTDFAPGTDFLSEMNSWIKARNLLYDRFELRMIPNYLLKVSAMRVLTDSPAIAYIQLNSIKLWILNLKSYNFQIYHKFRTIQAISTDLCLFQKNQRFFIHICIYLVRILSILSMLFEPLVQRVFHK